MIIVLTVGLGVWFTDEKISIAFSGATRYGTVMGERIRYVQSVNKYLSISEAGLEEYQLKNGDRVLMQFDNQTDKFIKAVPQKEHDGRLLSVMIGFLIIMFLCILFLMVWSLIAQGTIGRAFSLYYSLCLKRDNPAWMAEKRRGLYE